MVVSSTVGGFNGASVEVALVVLVITIPGTFFIVVVIWTAAVPSVVVSGVLLKVMLLRGGSTVSAILLSVGKSLVLALHLLFEEGYNSRL